VASNRNITILQIGAYKWNHWRQKYPHAEVDLSGINLRGADLSRADLNDVNLAGADLSNTRLRSANLDNADLTGADLSRANLDFASLNRTSLVGATLISTRLSNTYLGEAILCGATLNGTILNGANLSWADLSNADLHSATFDEANLSNTDLRSSHLTKATFQHIDGEPLWPALTKDESAALQQEVQDITTPPERLAELAGSWPGVTMRKLIASNPNTPTSILLDVASIFPAAFLANPILLLLFLDNPRWIPPEEAQAIRDAILHSPDHLTLASTYPSLIQLIEQCTAGAKT